MGDVLLAEVDVEAFTLAEQIPKDATHYRVEKHWRLVSINLDISKQRDHVGTKHHN